ncbi:MAG: helix-turn-helix transcriptional regulator [Rickettsia endosymbiont of Pseudomimeciton antennatum]|nr:helix-turn-helix transcriptional regulator [Rickettsia endosymbiont of Pseudomimeciton antennatum]MCC8398614.1 helix-turn-helix transcriptional regulator [Rickettsia endosymbiont of Labidopullus appendiculatus]
MTLVKEIQKFLRLKFEELKLTRKTFSKESGIPYNNITSILNGLSSSTQMYNILKIANYFKCSMDEVVGRNQYISLPNTKSLEFYEIIPSDITSNIKRFLIDKAKKQNLNLYKLSMDIGFGNNSLNNFVNGKRKQKTFNSQIAVALADYFQVSLDEMVGRIKPATSDNNESSQQSSTPDQN